MQRAIDQVEPTGGVAVEKSGIARRAVIFLFGHSLFLAAAVWLFSAF